MKRILLCFGIITLIFSCDKHYKYNIKIDSYDLTEVIDSVSIVDTQEFLGESYFKFRTLRTGSEGQISHLCGNNGESYEYLKESDGNLINKEGTVIFTNSKYEKRMVREDPFGKMHEVLVEGDSIINTEAGAFSCINSERYQINTNGNRSESLDRYYYADGYGLIYNTISYLYFSTPVIIRRLDSYQIQ